MRPSLLSRPHIHTTAAMALAASLAVVGPTFVAHPAHATGSSSISGRTFEDMNRDGVFDAGDVILTNQQLYLLDGAGNYLTTVTSDGNGDYTFTGLSDGNYVVEYAGPSSANLDQNWVPDTTGSIQPTATLNLVGSATANFGWRPIVRSTSANSPIATYTAPTGLVIKSYDDAVNPADIYATLTKGSLVGKEAASVTIDFDLNSSSQTQAVSAQDSSGHYISYAAVSYIDWQSWLVHGEQTLFHEYGHAWSLYFAYLAQQDPTLTSYLNARGLSGNPNVNTTYAWSAREMIAEDYRQLFGTPAAAAAALMNTQVPPANQISGLQNFLSSSYMQPVTTSASPPPSPPTVAMSHLTISPQPVKTSGSFSFTQSLQASDTVQILNSSGTLVKTLLFKSTQPAGSVSATWDRTNSAGKRVGAGAYTAQVTATDAYGHAVTSALSFSVS